MSVQLDKDNYRQFLKVALVCDPADEMLKQPPVRWALEQLQERLTDRGVPTSLHASLEQVPSEALADMERQWSERAASTRESDQTDGLRAVIAQATGASAGMQASRPGCLHLPPASFCPGKPLTIEMAVEPGHELTSARLHFRHVNQADEFQVIEMSLQDGRYSAAIPADYTDSPYPLLYYFELHDGRGDAWLWPGLAADLANQPYFVVRRA